ncbi:hypothetical protein D1AOALGA4SA_5476 [Olavius algarvensis Delta 1 endosymbiont]|nr:hypothetical protein D1AOALGA4SA_5476 [Olavius algarvensis Delta 1 endosymbiont]
MEIFLAPNTTIEDDWPNLIVVGDTNQSKSQIFQKNSF